MMIHITRNRNGEIGLFYGGREWRRAEELADYIREKVKRREGNNGDGISIGIAAKNIEDFTRMIGMKEHLCELLSDVVARRYDPKN